MQKGLNSIFPLPIFIEQAEGSEYESIQKELTEVKSKLKFNDTENGHMILNDNPFRSHFLLSYNCSHTINFINKNIESYITSLHGESKIKWKVIESWMTKTLTGRSAREHNHNAYDISGVYYLDTNGKDGNLVLNNVHPHLVANGLLTDVYKYGDLELPLENGIIMLWPSQLRHRTLVNQTDHERISISFNVILERKGMTLN
tara:strand:+ start:115 stop:720 length:606 start_codon:yes stop_codon:yes gene_type:complete